jgi:hypothetical protein
VDAPVSAVHHARRLDRLRAFLRTLPAGIAPDDATAIADGIDRYIAQRCSLEEAMGVRLDVGEKHPGANLARADRDAHLRAAAALLGGVSRANSGKLADLLKSYEACAWLRERGRETCPPHRVGRIEGHFWAALRAWPASLDHKRIHQIVAASKELKSAIEFPMGNARSDSQG